MKIDEVAEIKEQITNKVIHYIKKANNIFDETIFVPTIIFKTKSKSAAKITYYRFPPHCFQIDFNLGIALLQKKEFIKRTPLHEVAHLVAIQCYGWKDGRGHKSKWRFVISKLSPEIGNIERCHHYKLPTYSKIKRKGRKYKYKCNCRNVSVSKIIHNRIKRKKYYFCKKCRSKLIRGCRDDK